jgi:hypothetical protein
MTPRACRRRRPVIARHFEKPRNTHGFVTVECNRPVQLRMFAAVSSAIITTVLRLNQTVLQGAKRENPVAIGRNPVGAMVDAGSGSVMIGDYPFLWVEFLG